MGELSKRDFKRDRLVIKLYNAGWTQGQIGERLNLTKGRIGQIYRRILQENESRSIKDTLNIKEV